jgi:hypothetical protein
MGLAGPWRGPEVDPLIAEDRAMLAIADEVIE